MSRAPPFPTNAGTPSRPPTNVNGNGLPRDVRSASTRPLQIGRPTRPTSPNDTGYVPNGPTRPTRSDLRPSGQVPVEYPISEASSSRGPNYARDGQDAGAYGEMRYEAGSPPRQRAQNANMTPTRPAVRRDRSGTMNTMSSGSVNGADEPSSLGGVLSAFQSAGVRARVANATDPEWDRQREREIEEEQARQQRIRDRVPGRKVNGKQRTLGDIDAVLDEIKDEWDFVIDPDFNPVDLALQLLEDNNSRGKSLGSFRRTKTMLSKALKGSVDRYHQAFAASLPHHASVFSHLELSQTQVKEARTALLESKEALGNKRADLVQIWSRGETIEEMIRILDQIEHLKNVADVLESLISEKRFLQAAVILVRSLKMVNNPDMQEVGALADIRGYLISQETALREILVDELHSHLYLKSFWCESRWAAYVHGQQTMPKVEFEDDAPSADPTRNTSSRRSRLTRFLDDLALRPNESPFDANELSFRSGAFTALLSSVSSNGVSALQDQNPEANSFTYLETVLESLAVLGKLGSALDVVAQRLPSEIYSLIESTLEEVSERVEFNRQEATPGSGVSGQSLGRLDAYATVLFSLSEDAGALSGIGRRIVPGRSKDGFLSASSLRLAALESTAKHADHEIIQDLFWTLYSKLDAVIQGLRVVYEVSNRIGSRRDFKDSSGAKPGSLFPLAEIWLPINGEVRTLLHDYITDEESGAVSGRNPISSINEVLREGRIARDKSNPVFRFADTDVKAATRTLRLHEDELTRVLRDTVPGLVQAPSEGAVQLALSALGTDERMLGQGQHHRLLVAPDAFHVSVLFQPTLAFMARIVDILPSGLESARAATTILDEFVLKVYLPQLEEKVLLLFQLAINGSEAFQPDPSSYRLSAEPLIKASTQLMALTNSLCVMLRTSPFHRENYARLILGVIIQFYQRCFDRFQLLVARDAAYDDDRATAVVLAAQWAQSSQFAPCLAELLTISNEDTTREQQLCRQETQLELGALGSDIISRDQLVPSSRELSELCNLYWSVAWFGTELGKLKVASEEPTSPSSPGLLEPMSAKTPLPSSLPQLLPAGPDEQLKLPLSRDMAMRFQALLKTYDLLAELILYTIRMDVRCRTIFHLDLASKSGNYFSDHESAEPDTHVTTLLTELAEVDDTIAATLPDRERRFVFSGLPELMTHLLITGGRHIRKANATGMRRMLRNVRALEQGAKRFTSAPTGPDVDTSFGRARQYYNLFFLGPTDMLESVRAKQIFTFDEYQSMLNLQCGVDPTLGDAGAQAATDRNYSLYMIDLHGLEMEGPGPNNT